MGWALAASDGGGRFRVRCKTATLPKLQRKRGRIDIFICLYGDVHKGGDAIFYIIRVVSNTVLNLILLLYVAFFYLHSTETVWGQ